MNTPRDKKIGRKTSKKVQEMVIFSMLATLMFCSKIIMEALPNIHLLGVLTMVYTLVFRFKALIPIYIYVLINGIYAGFSMWWIPYLYIWTVLWLITMLLPKKTPKLLLQFILPLICCLHGLAFGALYAPIQAIMFGMNLEQTVAWIISGLPFDLIHSVSNFIVGFMILPLSSMLKRLLNQLN